MAQARKTFFSLGGPTYIDDPRVNEAQRWQQLQQAQQAQAQQAQAQQRAMTNAAADRQMRWALAQQEGTLARERLAQQDRQFGAQQAGQVSRGKARRAHELSLQELITGRQEAKETRDAAERRKRDEATQRRWFDKEERDEEWKRREWAQDKRDRDAVAEKEARQVRLGLLQKAEQLSELDPKERKEAADILARQVIETGDPDLLKRFSEHMLRLRRADEKAGRAGFWSRRARGLLPFEPDPDELRQRLKGEHPLPFTPGSGIQLDGEPDDGLERELMQGDIDRRHPGPDSSNPDLQAPGGSVDEYLKKRRSEDWRWQGPRGQGQSRGAPRPAKQPAPQVDSTEWIKSLQIPSGHLQGQYMQPEPVIPQHMQPEPSIPLYPQQGQPPTEEGYQRLLRDEGFKRQLQKALERELKSDESPPKLKKQRKHRRISRGTGKAGAPGGELGTTELADWVMSLVTSAVGGSRMSEEERRKSFRHHALPEYAPWLDALLSRLEDGGFGGGG